MDTNQLKQGISMIWEMEKNNYLMTAAIKKLNYRINQLGKANKYKMPEKKEVCYDYYGWGFGLFLGAIAGVILAIVFIKILKKVIGKTHNDHELLVRAGLFLLVILVVAIIGCILGGIWQRGENKKKEKKRDTMYKAELKKYAQTLENDKARVARELYEQKILIAERDSLRKKMDESIRLTRNIYSKLNIDHNFRNIIPIGYMEEFLRLGIATQLEGLNGLYALVRQELRADQMQYSLDQIGQKLDQIIDKQSSIYLAICGVGTQCNQIVQQSEQSAMLAAKNNKALDEVVNLSRISAYNEERARREIEFRNFVDLAILS